MVGFDEYVMPIVAIGVYAICAVCKPFFKKKDASQYIPLFAALVGVVFAFWYSKNFDFATFITGLVSGLGATGVDQVVSIKFGSKGTDDDEVPLH